MVFVVVVGAEARSGGDGRQLVVNVSEAADGSLASAARAPQTVPQTARASTNKQFQSKRRPII